MHKIKGDNSAAKAFLKEWNPNGPWVLTAIDPFGKGIETKTFYPDNEKGLDEWLRKYNGKWNVYFQVNTPMHDLNKKASREDIKSVDWLHVDIDPAPSDNINKERDRCLDHLIDKLPKGIPAPTVIIFSGGGYQGFWKIDEPVIINGDLQKAEEEKLYNKKLEQDFDADNCHNIDRIMRLAGTVNIPNDKKLKQGRKPELAKVIVFDKTRVYKIDQFEKLKNQTPPKDINLYKKWEQKFTYNCVLPDLIQPVDDIEETLSQYNLPEDISRTCKYGKDPENPERKGDNTRSGWLFSTLCRMVMYGVPDEVIYAIITDKKFGIAESVLENKGNTRKYAIYQIEKAHEFLAKEGKLILYDGSPYRSAKEYLWRHRPHILHNNGDWFDYNGASYTEIETGTIKAELYGFLDKQLTMARDNIVPFNPAKSKVEKIVDALAGYVHKPIGSFSPPCFLYENEINPKEILVCRNGLLHLPTQKLYPPTPDFFSLNALDFDYVPDAPPPEKWGKFLDDLWPDDEQPKETLQEIFGYLLTSDTSLQKIFLMIGPKRSGKGTIARILTKLLGTTNICAPTLSSMCGDFGLQPLIGKQLAIISDMRMGKRTDKAVVSENLLRISGEDAVTANRKHKVEWNGTLSARFLIMTNEIPRLDDVSGALASRFMPLIMRNSFYGRENPNLVEELVEELPAILNWSIKGWQRLYTRGHFILPSSAKDALQELSDIASPISAFIRDECELTAGAVTAKTELYKAYTNWNDRNGYYYTPDMAVFGRDLNSALQGKIKSTKPSINGVRVPSYAGIKLKSAQQEQKKIPF